MPSPRAAVSNADLDFSVRSVSTLATLSSPYSSLKWCITAVRFCPSISRSTSKTVTRSGFRNLQRLVWDSSRRGFICVMPSRYSNTKPIPLPLPAPTSEPASQQPSTIPCRLRKYLLQRTLLISELSHVLFRHSLTSSRVRASCS